MSDSGSPYGRSAALEAVARIRQAGDHQATLGVILGTGLDALAEMIEVEHTIAYKDIPHFPVSTVASHAGDLLLGRLAGRPIVALRGRAHIYEGYSAQHVSFPVRVLGELGVTTLILSNACGGMNPDYRAADIMLIEDHINLMGHNPLEGPNEADWGPRFPDMSDPYNADLRAVVRTTATELGIDLHEGVYISVVGPNLETRAEYAMLRGMGADVVGMSTVPEVIAAKHMGMGVIGFSVITDECFPETLAPISIDDVLAAAAQATPKLCALIEKVVPALPA